MLRRTLIGAGLVGFAALFGLFYYLNSHGLSEDDIRRRCETARPAWQSYQEDIKAQIGAGPVAAWQGHPVEAQFGNDAIVVAFEIQGKWAERDAALPVLLRLPTGEVRTGNFAGRAGARHSYAFTLEASLGQAPWAEIRYPHHAVRMVPDGEGLWRASVANK